MSGTLSEPIAAYFTAANHHDVDAMLSPFAADAVVVDEGQERRGTPAIRSWMEETNRKYRATAEVIDAVDTGGKTVVTAMVAGTFPGSPAQLHYAFTLAGGQIARLEIG